MSLITSLRLCRSPATGFAALGMLWGAFAALAPQIKAQVGASDATFGLLLMGTAAGLTSTIWLAPRYDASLKHLSLPVAMVMAGLAFLLPGHANTPLALFLIMMLLGMCSGLLDVVVNARVSELEMLHRRPFMNANHGTFSLFYAIGALATGAAREAQLEAWAILTPFALIAMALAAAARGPVYAPPADADTPSVLPLALIGLCGGIVLVAFMAEAAVEAWSALHIERSLGGRAAQGALGPALLGITMTIGRFYGQTLTERFAETKMIEIAGLLTITGTLIAAAATSPAMAYVGFALLGLGVSVIGPLGLALVGRLAPPALRTQAIAKVAVMGFLGFFIAPATVGFVAEATNLATAFLVVAGMLALLPVLTLILRLRHGA